MAVFEQTYLQAMKNHKDMRGYLFTPSAGS